MGLFGPKKSKPSAEPWLTPDVGLFEGGVDPVERPGTAERRIRVFAEAVRLAERGADVREELTAALAREGSLVKWISLRGAVLELQLAAERGRGSLGEMQRAVGAPAPAGLDSVLGRYPEVARLGFEQVLADPSLNRPLDWHFDVISWSAHAVRTVDVLAGPELPRAARLSEPGWYTEPVFAKAERFWNGKDWTELCRRLGGPYDQVFRVPF